MTSPESGADEFDVVVIGAGPTGENAADYAVRNGLTAALVEAERVGGECSFWACIPSKALLRTGHAVAAARRLPGVEVSFDPAAVLARRDSFVHDLDDTSQVDWAVAAGIEVVRGVGRLDGERTVRVGARVLRARHAVVVATGSVPVRPPVEGLDSVRTWGSREATNAGEVPARFGVLGGGVVGCELAQAFCRLGSAVTLVNHGPRLLPSAEPVAGERVAAAMRDEGIDVRLDQGLDAVSPGPGGSIVLHLGDERIEVDELLVATGRRPNTADIGLDTVGLEPGGPLTVDDSGLALGDWLYGAGDVTGRAPLTHMGKYAARIVGAAIAARAAGTPLDTGPWGEHCATADHAAVPQVVFTDPEVASVGLTSEKARAAGLPVRVVQIDIAVAGSSLQADGYTGSATMVVDTEREVLLGITFVGQDVAEMVHAATIAVVGEVPLARLWHAVPSFPTISEVWLRLLETYRSGA
ncbi:MAG: NAD(P)/FAD-dependent oxidoreductase [Pseudonocardia sp.]|uniref:dihydrolipoyl dehydrogenase family protein n=1 Tax=unclassified Pseudonocardia TaxID=2619320 RepID=UPI00086C7B3D|nr:MULTISPECIES: NAD(P)/FAD-dependent oxidoreductase [unclassified Pseudonocardia]MBN9109846.1 NAD(P)/FAD-dependent oxidoreductase [Pseudonocardia sp.]ODU13915.1 MAG: pyridine nucleotide-disulfide oxidoreductase [Pseudonocardia sp. SCN 72-51]ODV03227.1 MAG: pyridine nucleotide-disulfide oxidoreductase [Pseudonocardia sp. SCN 73-27]